MLAASLLGVTATLVQADPVAPPPHLDASWSHGWDCIACDTNSMLSGNFGISNQFQLDDPWWIKEVAGRYAQVLLSNFEDNGNYNGTGEYPLVTLARALKKENPKVKTMLYQAADRGSLVVKGTKEIMAHPEWWLHDDLGNVVWFGGASGVGVHPQLDWTVPAVHDWFISYPLSLFDSPEQAAELFDGLFVDAGGFSPWAYATRNISAARYTTLYEGKMAMLRKAQANCTALNGGLVVANSALGLYSIPASLHPGEPNIDWTQDVGAFGGGSFTEWFGSIWMQEPDGRWNVSMMERVFENVVNSSRAGYPVVLKAAPGPATANFTHRGSAGKPGFTVAEWAGDTPLPATVEGVQEAVASVLVQSLAPFLIVAEHNVFFSYAFFYDMVSGYIPCPKAGIECAMPTSWFPEFEKPLGPPDGPAVKKGTVYTRTFKHAAVYVDLADRYASKITWH